MDIKNVFKIPFISPLLKSSGQTQVKATKTNLTEDREGHGQSPYKKNLKHRLMTPEEFDLALDRLKKLEAVVQSQWTIVVDPRGYLFGVQVIGSDGQIIKKIELQDLWSLLENQESQKGHLVSKVA